MAPALTLANILSAARNDSLDSLFAAPPASEPAPAPATPPRELQLFSDGSVRGNGSHAGCAYAFFSRSDNLWHGMAFALGAIGDPYVAELYGIYAALCECGDLSGRFDHFTIKSDCRDALNDINALRRKTRPRCDKLLQDILDKISELERNGKQVNLKWIKGHSPVYACEGNRVADQKAYFASACCRGNCHWRKRFLVEPEDLPPSFEYSDEW